MNWMKKILLICVQIAVAAGLFLAAGCSTLEPETNPGQAVLTVHQLEKEMLRARDDQGIFLKAKSYVQRQVSTDPQGEKQLCEFYYMAPDRFNLTILKDNQPETAIIMNGPSGWIADYKKRTVLALSGENLHRMQVMFRLGNPDDSYQDLFKEVQLTTCTIANEDLYKLHCIGKNGGIIDIYVGKNSYLLRRMRFPQYDAESVVKSYSLFEGVMMPDVTETITPRGISKSEIMTNKLYVEIPQEIFLPPVFPRAE